VNWIKLWRPIVATVAAVSLTGAAAVATRPGDLSEVVSPHYVPPNSGLNAVNLLMFCGDAPLATTLSPIPVDQPSPRVSAILAVGRLTAIRGNEPAFTGPPRYQKMVLDSVRTLGGPRVPDGAGAWINTSSRYEDWLPLSSQPVFSEDLGSLWGPDGRMFAFYLWDFYAVGPTLVTAPLVGDQVIFSQAGCWNVDGLPSRPYRGPVAQVPGSHTYELVAQSRMGFRAVPLAVVLGLLTKQ